MKIRRVICLILSLLMLAGLAACGNGKEEMQTDPNHVHVPGAPATCTEPQVCLECGAVLEPAKGHVSADPDCEKPQICAVCGVEIAPATGHTPSGEVSCVTSVTCTVCGTVLNAAAGHFLDDDGVCTVCGQQIGSDSKRYTGPNGRDLAKSTFPDSVIPETQVGGHYTNDIDESYIRGDILICGDYGMEYYTPSPSGLPDYAAAIKAFAEKYPEVNVTSVLIPKCCTFEPPKDARDPYENTKAFIENTYAAMGDSVKKADVFGQMDAHDGEYMFYRTDHHWTSLGAYYASVAYCEANGITPYALDSYETVVKTDFIGTLYSFSGGAGALTRNPDYTVGHYPHTGYTMSCYAGYWYGATAINPNYNNYANVFIDGDVPLEVFETDVKNGKALILFKESYGNAFVPYMLDYYERVVVVDIRETTDSVATLIERYGITDAAIVNNIAAATSFIGKVRDKILS